MTTNSANVFALCLASACAAGCSAEAVPPPDLDTPRIGQGTQTCNPDEDPLPNTCWAVTVVLPGDECPDHFLSTQLSADWVRAGREGRLFTDGTRALAEVSLRERESALDRFCFYRWTIPAEPPEGAETWMLDCAVALGQAPSRNSEVPLPPSCRADLQRTALAHAGALAPGVHPGPNPVMVVVVDTGSDVGSPDPDDHGGTMAGLVDRLACNDTRNCPVATRRALALPIDPDGVLVDPDGAVYGTRAQVAAGIVEAVDTWRALALSEQARRRPAPRLVINLSLGWVAATVGDVRTEAEPWLGPDTVDDFANFVTQVGTGNAPTDGLTDARAPIEAVHAALLYASCQGALLVAAAGNKEVDDRSGNPMAPASWAGYETPTRAQCTGLLGFPEPLEASWVTQDTQERPLIVSVSAVDHDGRPILATRDGTKTTLAAPGYFAGAGPTPLTGTSISSALVSGAAALVWSHEPRLTPADVMELLHETASPLSGSASSGVLSACGAAAASSHTLRASMCGPEDTFESAVDDLHQCVNAQPHEIDVTLGRADWAEDPRTSDAVDECPPRLAGPQPNTPICPDCPLVDVGGASTAVLQLNQDYVDLGLSDGTVTLVDADGSTMTFGLDPGEVDVLAGGGKLVFSLGQHDAVVQAEVTFRVQESPWKKYWRTSQLLVAN